jgi:hypothetical protein
LKRAERMPEGRGARWLERVAAASGGFDRPRPRRAPPEAGRRGIEAVRLGVRGSR